MLFYDKILCVGKSFSDGVSKPVLGSSLRQDVKKLQLLCGWRAVNIKNKPTIQPKIVSNLQPLDFCPAVYC